MPQSYFTSYAKGRPWLECDALPLIIVGGAAVGVEIVIDGDNMLDIVELRCATIESM